MEKKEFEALLKRHDWYYRFSDDRNAWHKGLNEEHEIMSILEKQPEYQEIYNVYKAS